MCLQCDGRAKREEKPFKSSLDWTLLKSKSYSARTKSPPQVLERPGRRRRQRKTPLGLVAECLDMKSEDERWQSEASGIKLRAPGDHGSCPITRGRYYTQPHYVLCSSLRVMAFFEWGFFWCLAKQRKAGRCVVLWMELASSVNKGKSFCRVWQKKKKGSKSTT